VFTCRATNPGEAVGESSCYRRIAETPRHRFIVCLYSRLSRRQNTPVNLYRVILPVSDIHRAAQFYATVFQDPGRRVSPGRHYFACGPTILACYDPVADGDGEQGGWRFHPLQYLYFAVADLDGTFARVQSAAGHLEGPIATMPWGERLFYARDPFGSRISFVDSTTLFTG
jgi:predicted enzyme related to lactoylglutathione lyase